MDQEILELLKKGAIWKVKHHTRGEFLNNLFLVDKKDGGGGLTIKKF